MDEFERKIMKYGLDHYEIVKDGDGYAESYSYYLWCNLPQLIELHRKIRDSQNIHFEKKTLNISVIINCAIIIEGFLYELLKQPITYLPEEDTLDSRFMNEIFEKLDNSSWTEIKKHYKLIFNRILQKETSEVNWKNIQYLFQFRNMLTHSKPIKYIVKFIDNKPTPIHIGKYELIYKFLIEKKLINEIDFPISMRTELVNSNVADFFWNETQEFLKNIARNNLEFKNGPICENYERAFKNKRN